jgi:hypothetical protein
VAWELADGNGDGRGQWVRLRWAETGGPALAQQAPAASLGTELVKGFATLELRGRYAARYPRDGAEYVLEFPISEQEHEPVGLVYGGLGGGVDAGAEAAFAPAVPPVALAGDGPADPLDEPLAERDPSPSRVRPRPTRRRR